MADFNSSLPTRTENNGDVVVRVVDGTVTSQALNVDASGKVTTKLNDGAGNAVTSQTSGGQRALDVGINVAGTQIDPRQVRALTATDVVTANQGTANTIVNGWPVKPTDGTNSQGYTAAGEAKVSVTQPLPTGTNVIGSVNQGTSPWITRDQSDGAVTPGTAATFSSLAGGQFNTALPTLTTGQQSAMQLDSSGRLIIRPLVATTDAVSSRTQDGLGNAITSTAAGSTRPMDVALRDAAGLVYSATNPLPVAFSSDTLGTEIANYNTAAAVAAAGSSNHDYTVTAGKTLLLSQIEATGSGRAKIEVQVETGAATGVFTTRFVQFNSTAAPNMTIDLKNPISVAAGVRVRVIRTNRDLLAQDLYSTIVGVEVP